MSDKKIYPVLSAVRHDGTLYAPDDPENDHITLSEKDAEPLLKLKVIDTPVAGIDLAVPDPSDDSQNAALSPEARHQAILNAFTSLNAETDMTKAGEPKVKAVEALLGFDVSADEVKAAWAEVQRKAAAVTGAGDNQPQTGNE